jgi:hypothetical protein
VGPRNIQFVMTLNRHSFGTRCILRRMDDVLCIQLCNPLFFFFGHIHTRGGEEIRTSDLRFMRRGPQPIELCLVDFATQS